MKRKRSITQYSLEGKAIRVWDSARDVQNELGYNESNINNCCNGRLKKAYDFIWKYTDENFTQPQQE